jgi:hypothetical protein
MKLLTLAALIFSSSAFAGDIFSREHTWVDTWGKTWNLSGKPCLNNSTACIDGLRDPQNTIGCKYLPVRGTESISPYGDNTITLTVFATTPDCASSTWIAVYRPATQTFEGYSVNDEGKHTAFKLFSARSSSRPRVEGTPATDPSLRTRPRK